MYIRLLSEILSHYGQTLQRQVMIDDVCHECQHQYGVYGEGEELGQVTVGIVHAEIEEDCYSHVHGYRLERAT